MDATQSVARFVCDRCSLFVSQILRHRSPAECDGRAQQVADEKADRGHVVGSSRSRVALPVLPQFHVHHPQSLRRRVAPDLRRPLRRPRSLSSRVLSAAVRRRVPRADDPDRRHVCACRRHSAPADDSRRQRRPDHQAAGGEQTQSNYTPHTTDTCIHTVLTK